MFRYKLVGSILATAAASFSAPAIAQQIVYLECNLPTGESGPAILWKLALDERAKTVSFEHPQASGTVPAIFAADKVTWRDGRFILSRVNLTFSREFLGATDTGKCKVVQPPKRAF